MSLSLIAVEGKDDLAALREILPRFLGMPKVVDPIPLYQPGTTFRKAGSLHSVILVSGGSRDLAALRAREWLADEANSPRGLSRVGVVFDPNGHDDTEWRAWFEQEVFGVPPAIAPDGIGYVLSIGGRGLEVIPVPWDAGPLLDDLPSLKRNLERVALGVLNRALPADEALLLELLARLVGSGRVVTWKTAFRLLNAMRHPDTEDGYMAKVFGQDPDLRPGILSTLQSTLLYRRLERLAQAD